MSTMTAKTDQNTTKTFKFSYPTCTNKDVVFKLEVPVEIPHAGSTRELVQRVINMFHIPVYLEEELNEKLAEFVTEETKIFHNERDEKLLNQLKNSEINVEGIVKGWEKQFKDNVVEFAEQKGTSDEEVFAAAYHKLVHSPALETILQVENSYAETVTKMLKNRDEDIHKLTQKQTEEMEEKVRLLNVSTTEEEINELAARQFEEQALVAGRWGSQIDALSQTQRAQHRAWLMQTLEEYQSTSALNTPSNSPLATFSPSSIPVGPPPPAAGQRLEESFTIHLGSQLKQTHNVRIVAMDILDLCAVADPSDASRRLQTSLSLYSSSLSAVLLVSECAPRRAGRADAAAPPAERLAAAAVGSTDHHFPHVEHQLRDIADRLHEPVEKRNAERAKLQAESNNATQNCTNGARLRGKRNLQTGDIFITKHSNLAEVHVVFHLIADDSSLRSGDMTSRHPAILGLRSAMKAACANDVTSLCIPLLLRHELSEEMTAAWCARRAELVLKCAKGFMLEGAGGGGAPLGTLHLALPPRTAPPLFAALAQLLPSVFRLSNPVKVKPPSSVAH